MLYLFYTIHVLNCLFLILVVLLQQGKGADLSVFGGGGTMTAFGARGAATLLHKMTVFGFVAFIVTTLAIGILQKGSAGSSVMSDVPAVEKTTATADQDVGEAVDEAAADVPGAFGEADVPAEAAAPSETAAPADGGDADAAGEKGDTEDPATDP